MRSFHDLQVWGKSHQLTLDVYTVTSSFPKEELYGLTSQLRRAAHSIPTNIAEGCGRHSGQDFVRFIHIATGSASELEYELLLAHDLRLLDERRYRDLTDEVTEVKRMLHAFSKKLMADC